MGGNVAENLSNQSVPEAAARVAAVVNRLVNRIGSNAESRERLAEIEIPEELRDNLALFLRLERRVLSEYDPEIADLFDKILTAEIVVNAGNPGTCAADEAVDEQGVPTADEPTAVAFREVVDLIDSLPLDKQQVIVRAFTSFSIWQTCRRRTTVWRSCVSARPVRRPIPRSILPTSLPLPITSW